MSVEKVARAIAQRRLQEEGSLGEVIMKFDQAEREASFSHVWESPGPVSDRQRASYRADARAALSALLPASDDVLRAVAIAGCEHQSCRNKTFCFRLNKKVCLARARRSWEAGVKAEMGDTK